MKRSDCVFRGSDRWQRHHPCVGQQSLVFGAGQELDEIDRFRRRVHANSEAISTAEHIGRIAGSTFNQWEGEDAEIVADTFATFGFVGLDGGSPRTHQFDGRLAVAHDCGRFGIGRAEESILEWLELDQTLEQRAGLDERRIGEAAAAVYAASNAALPPVRVAR